MRNIECNVKKSKAANISKDLVLTFITIGRFRPLDFEFKVCLIVSFTSAAFIPITLRNDTQRKCLHRLFSAQIGRFRTKGHRQLSTHIAHFDPNIGRFRLYPVELSVQKMGKYLNFKNCKRSFSLI